VSPNTLSRRAVVASTLLGGGALGGCAAPLEPSRPKLSDGTLLLGPEEVEREWARLTAPRERMVPGRPLALDSVLAGGRSKGKVGRDGESDDVVLQAVRTLFLTGAFKDLPETARVHPTVQDTMWSALPEFDAAILGMKRRLDGLAPTERADLAREFRRDPEVAERVLAIVDEAAADKDVSDVRRLHLRRMGLWVCDRLNHSSELLVGEYSRKLERIYERPTTFAESERKLMARLGTETFTAMRSRLQEAEELYRVAGVQRVGKTDGEGEDEDGEGKSRTATNCLIAGGVFMGLATIAGIGGGIALASGGIAGAFVLTAGGVFLLVGLILLIVGAAMG
jgi:hypothetical protein